MVSPGWAAFMAFWMDSPGPTTELCAPAEPILVTARATPLATNRVRAMVANNTMVRLIRRAAFLQGGGVSVVVRRHSRRPFISNRRSINAVSGQTYHSNELSLLLLGRGLRVANFLELRQCEVRRILLKRTSENAQNANFAVAEF